MEPLGSHISYVIDTRTSVNGKVECILKYDVKRTFDYKTWEERHVHLKTFGQTAEKAAASANLLLNTQMTKCNYDFFSVEQKELLND